jgi:hypothetical protein
VERWRELVEAPLERTQLRLKLESAEATSDALEQLRLIMASATKRVWTSSGLREVPDWSTRLKACRLVMAMAVAAVPELGGQASHAQADLRLGSCPKGALQPAASPAALALQNVSTTSALLAREPPCRAENPLTRPENASTDVTRAVCVPVGGRVR